MPGHLEPGATRSGGTGNLSSAGDEEPEEEKDRVGGVYEKTGGAVVAYRISSAIENGGRAIERNHPSAALVSERFELSISRVEKE